ncbi:MAG: hybrid sensor histidine kinase/response regulator [Pirellulaceae bacterium]
MANRSPGPRPDDSADLRRRAEEKARADKAQVTLSPEETGRLLHELQVHQIELEMQNEELRRIQGEVEASRARYFDLYDLAPVGYFTLSEQGLILEANLTGARLLGVERIALVRQRLTRFVLPADQDIYYKQRKQLFETGSPQAYEIRMLRADAAPFWARMEATVAQEAAGAPVCRTVMSDITAQKQAEENLADQDRRKDEFLAMLSHELRNPLAPILNAVQLLQLQKNENPVQQKAHAIIGRQVRQLTRLVDDLMDVSRIINGRIPLCREQVAVSDIVERAVETTRPLIDQCRHELTVSLPPAPIWLYADAARLEQVVTNLLTNAAKYTNEGGRIWLSVQQEGGQAVLRVQDTGCGIDPALLPHVFDLFTQAQRSSDRLQGGLGIGLALVKRLVEMHNGTVTVLSTLGIGSQFVVRLTACPPESLSVQMRSPLTKIAKPVGPTLRVLVVDDNVDAAKVLELLVQAAGHQVRLAHTGPTALTAALDYRPDVMLLDIGVPELDGFEVARRIRQQPVLRDIVLVSITGYGQESDRQRMREAGFDHYLIKPADFEKVRQILTAVSEKAT